MASPRSAPTARDSGRSTGTRSRRPTPRCRRWTCAPCRTGRCGRSCAPPRGWTTSRRGAGSRNSSRSSSTPTSSSSTTWVSRPSSTHWARTTARSVASPSISARSSTWCAGWDSSPTPPTSATSSLPSARAPRSMSATWPTSRRARPRASARSLRTARRSRSGSRSAASTRTPRASSTPPKRNSRSPRRRFPKGSPSPRSMTGPTSSTRPSAPPSAR